MLGQQSLVPAMLAFRGLPAIGIGTIALDTCNCKRGADLSAPLIVVQGILEGFYVAGGGDESTISELILVGQDGTGGMVIYAKRMEVLNSVLSVLVHP
ncbi:hypothetical protein HBI16_077510 [Parastagonospora nodorum]|nr:hypothetical protein HBI16_077510 [Parastagonospora nodorum]